MKIFDEYLQMLSREFPETRRENVPCYERFEAAAELHFPIHCQWEPILHVHYLHGKIRMTFFVLNRKLCGHYGITPEDPTAREFERESVGAWRDNPSFQRHIRKILRWQQRRTENTTEVPEERKRNVMDEILYSLSPEAVRYDYERRYRAQGNHDQIVMFRTARGMTAELSVRYAKKQGWIVDFKALEIQSKRIRFAFRERFSETVKAEIIARINQALLAMYAPQKGTDWKKSRRKIYRFIQELLTQIGSEAADVLHDETPPLQYHPERFCIRLPSRLQLEPVLEIYYYQKSWLVEYYILNRKLAGHCGIGSDDVCANIDRDYAWYPTDDNKLIEHIRKSLSWLGKQTCNEVEIPEERKIDGVTDLLSRLDPAILARGWQRHGFHAGNWQQYCEFQEFCGRDGHVEMTFGKKHWNLYFEIVEHTPEGGWIENDRRKFVLHCDYTPENADRVADHVNKAMHWMFAQTDKPWEFAEKTHLS